MRPDNDRKRELKEPDRTSHNWRRGESSLSPDALRRKKLKKQNKLSGGGKNSAEGRRVVRDQKIGELGSYLDRCNE